MYVGKDFDQANVGETDAYSFDFSARLAPGETLTAASWVVAGFSWVFTQLGINTDFVPALPTALMKPLSGSGSRAMMVDAMKTYGADSFVGRLACIFQGSADTTFYIVALYFGSVGIRKTRYSIPMGLLADLAGVVAAVFVAYLFFHA